MSELGSIKFGMEEMDCQVGLEFSISRVVRQQEGRGDKGLVRGYLRRLTWDQPG